MKTRGFCLNPAFFRKSFKLICAMKGDFRWAHQDSNLGPSDYESDALTN